MSDSITEIMPSKDGLTLYICVGNSMRGDDGAGILAASLIRPTDRVAVCEAGEATETGYDEALRLKPVKAVFIDAADMGLPAGTAQVLYEDTLADAAVSTHKIPVPLISRLIREETGAEIVILGIQPETVDFMSEMTESVAAACRAVAAMINSAG